MEVSQGGVRFPGGAGLMRAHLEELCGRRLILSDVVAAAKELARLQNVSAGYIVSKLVREALAGHQQAQTGGKLTAGFRPFPARGTLVTNEQINELRDHEGV